MHYSVRSLHYSAFLYCVDSLKLDYVNQAHRYPMCRDYSRRHQVPEQIRNTKGRRAGKEVKETVAETKT